jgi:hypothetical protein
MFLSVSASHAGPPAVSTQNNDSSRTGANLNETLLTPANVNVASFGKLGTLSLDANVNGQVLYVPNLTINGAVHNVIFAYTSNNSNNSPCSLYAFDADSPTASSPLWHTKLPNSAEWTTCTPVIDLSATPPTLYAVTKDTNDNGPTHLRAFDITTGNERTGSPITIAASVPGTGDGSTNGVVSFDTTHANCRPGLLLLNGVVYIAFAHNSDSFPYHGWVFGYSYNGSAFTQTAVFCTDPNGGEAGIWHAGKGLVADSNNNLYCATGNGTFDAASGGTSYGMSYLKLGTPSLNVLDYFTPYDELGNSDADLDLAGAGIVGIPGTDRIFGGATKFGSVFLLDTTNMGRFTAGGPDRCVQRLDNVSANDDVGQNPICWDATALKYVYLWPSGSNLLQFKYDPAVNQLNPAGIYKQTSSITSGGSLAVTANGSTNGILWAVGNNSVFHAFNATDVSQPELWNSSMNSSRDSLGSVGHFQFPTIVNGKAYVPTGSASIVVYGPIQASAPTLSSLAISPASVVGGNGNTATGTVTLTGPAPANGAQVSLSSNNGAASVPGSVTVAQGATTAQFTINTSAVTSATTVTVSATYGTTRTSTLSVQPAGTSHQLNLVPLADSYVRAGTYYSNNNYGSQNLLIVETAANNNSNSANRASYLKFDLTGVNFIPTSAILTLTVNSGSYPYGSTETLNVYDVRNTSWTESGITYNNAPGLNGSTFSSTGTLITSVGASLKTGTVTIDLTAYVKACAGQIVTLQLIDPNAESRAGYFNSKEASSGPPTLTVQ